MTHRVGLKPICGGDQAADHLKGHLGADLRHVPAATFGLQRIVHDVRTQRLEQQVQLDREIMVREALAVIRARDHAAEIRCNSQPGERLYHMLLDLFQADVMHNDIQQVPDLKRARDVGKPSGGERFIHQRAELRLLPHIVIGLGQVQKAGRAGSHQMLVPFTALAAMARLRAIRA